MRVAIYASIAIALTGSSAFAQSAIDICTRSTERPGAKIEACSLVIASRPNRSTLERSLNSRGLAYRDSQSYDRALADFDLLIQLNPRVAAYFDNRASVRSATGLFDRALADLNIAVAIAPRSAFVHFSRAKVKVEMGMYDEAIVDFSSSIALSPNNAFRYYDRANTFVRVGNLDRAIADFNRALDIDPRFYVALRDRGTTFARLGNIPAAKLDLQSYRAAVPDDVAARTALVEIETRGAGPSGPRPPAGSPATQSSIGSPSRETFYICSRAGCTVTVTRVSGRNTNIASATARLTEADAIAWCTEYEVPNWAEEGGMRILQACVAKTARADGGREHRISADCAAGIISNSNGDRWRLTDAARQGSQDFHEHWQVIDRPGNENERPPFEVNQSQFSFLCPAQASQYGLRN